MSDEITNRFENFVIRQGWKPAERLTILAVSGGLDSMVMAALFYQQGWPVVLAHLNFQLRGADSDADEELVRRWAEQRGLPLQVSHIDTASEATASGQGIQETARRVRYDWLEEVRNYFSAGYIATAHHLNDSVETMLFHQLRGCGLRGLHGIPAQNGTVIRPLLEFTRAELEVFAAENSVPFRTDASNLSLKYTRNHIRHRVLPVLLEVNPDFLHTAAGNMERLRGAEVLIDWALGYWRERFFGDGPLPEITRLELSVFPSAEGLRQFLLYELLHPYGFSADQIRQLSTPPFHTGSITESETHQLQYDRGAFLLAEKATRIGEEVVEIDLEQGVWPVGESRLHLKKVSPLPASQSDNPRRFYVSSDRLYFPLKLRAWRAGDVFHPKGMNGHSKKLKKFFTDEKIPRLQKERTWLLVNSDGRLIWVVGLRGDERFRAQPGKPAVELYWNSP